MDFLATVYCASPNSIMLLKEHISTHLSYAFSSNITLHLLLVHLEHFLTYFSNCKDLFDAASS